MKFSIAILCLIGFSHFSCQSRNTSSSTPGADSISHIVGNDKDSLGCKASAGYTWSQLKQTCIQPWEDGIKLHILNTSASFQTAAYVLIDSTSNKAEVFMAEENMSILLNKKDKENYTNGNFNLFRENHCWTLSLKETKLYQEPIM